MGERIGELKEQLQQERDARSRADERVDLMRSELNAQRKDLQQLAEELLTAKSNAVMPLARKAEVVGLHAQVAELDAKLESERVKYANLHKDLAEVRGSK